MIRSSLVKSLTAFIVLALLNVNISSKDVNVVSHPTVSAVAAAASHFTGSQQRNLVGSSSPHRKTQATTTTTYLHPNKKIHRTLGGEDEGHHHHTTTPWGEVLGSCFLVNIVTLSGVLFFTKSCSKEGLTKKPEATIRNTFAKFAIPSFAAGALFATTLFLILPESFSHVQVGLAKGGGNGGEEGEIPVDVTWRVGMCILIGFLVPAVLDIFTGRHDHDQNGLVRVHQREGENNADDEEALVENEQEEQNAIDWGLAGSLIIGDFLHNFGDGIFIGAAFYGCSKSLAWTIVGVTVYHEVAQEISDLLLLTRFAGFSLLQAICVNFLSGTSVILGGLIVLAIDVGDVALGVIFAISSGVYLQIALTECSPRANANMSTTKERLLGILMFTIGVVPIGLTLLNHNHCEAGHDHR